VLDTVCDLVGKVEKRTRKPWITQEMIDKMDERRKEGRMSTLKKAKVVKCSYLGQHYSH
jgi:hypothetical protein